MRFTIKQARNIAGITQAEMAKILGINRGTYIKIEKDVDHATVAQIKAISCATGIKPGDIFLFDNSTIVEKTQSSA